MWNKRSFFILVGMNIFILILLLCISIPLVAKFLNFWGFPWLWRYLKSRARSLKRKHYSPVTASQHQEEEGRLEAVAFGEATVRYHVETTSPSATSDDEVAGPSGRNILSEAHYGSFNKEHCLLCQKIKGPAITNVPGESTIANIVKLVEDRYRWGDTKAVQTCSLLVQSGRTSEDLAGGWWHRHCYLEYANVTQHKRAKERFDISQSPSTTSLLRRGKGKPSKRKLSDTESPESTPTRTLRSKVSAYNKTMCVFCQNETKELCHRVLTVPVNKRIISIIDNTKDDMLKLRFALIDDPIADDVLYHRDCLRKNEREVLLCINHCELNPKEVADIELLDWLVNFCKQNTDKLEINSNVLHGKYIELLVDCIDSNEVTSSCFGRYQFKKHIKSLIEENLTGFKFVTSYRKNEPEIITSEKGLSFAVNAAVKSNSSAWELRKMAKELRKSMSHCTNWKFMGDFNYESPLQLRYFLKLILFGEETTNLTEAKLNEINQTVSILSQLVAVNFKSNKSVRESTVDFVNTNEIKKQRKYFQNQTPVSVGLGMLLHGSTGMRSIVDDTSDLNITCKYQIIKKIECEMLKEVKKCNVTDDGIYIPRNMSLSIRPFFAVDNTDFQRSSKDGKGELHGTLIVMYQNNPEPVGIHINFNYEEENEQSGENEVDESISEETFTYKIQTCYPPKKPDTRVTKFRGTVYIEEKLFKTDDEAYALMQTCDEGNLVPTWKVYNSKLCEKSTKNTTYAMLPLLKTSPTDWSTLYTALKLCQGITTSIIPDKKTIITLDLQLYIKAIQLTDKLGDGVFFRVGELHVLFAMCHAIGKYIDSSGLDKLFTHAGIYGHLVVNKILEGKNMKRCMDAFLILYSSIFELLLKAFYETEPDIEDVIVDICRPLLTKLQTGINESLLGVHQSLLDQLNEIRFFERFRNFRTDLKKQGKFLSNVVDMIGNMLLYFRATRQKLWNLHLASQDNFVKYFFSLDLQNYARMMPVHLSHLYELRDVDRESWDFLKKNFTCDKTLGRFTAIGVDHALEQVNKELKGLGGIRGMSDEEIDKFCLIAPTKRALITQFSEEFKLQRGINNLNSDIHHEEIGTHRVFHKNSVRSFTTALMEFIDFKELVRSECCYNIMTHSILTNDSDLLEIEVIGEELYNTFIEERKSDGSINVWDCMKKRKLLTFKSLSKVVKLKVKGKLINLKEEKSLTTRLLVISRSRVGIDISELFSKHEFSVVPHSLFDIEGKMLKCDDKSYFLRGLEEALPSDLGDVQQQSARNCVVLDGMGFVNQLKMKGVIKLEDLIQQFTERIEKEVFNKSHVVLVFDSYDPSLSILKQATWDKRHKIQVQLKLSLVTIVKDISLKELLSHPTNKKVLTQYFAESCESLFRRQDKTYIIAFGTKLLSNVPHLVNTSHKHPEADTLMICLINEISQLIPDLKVLLVSPDTDVFMLAVNYVATHPMTDILFELLTSKGRRNIQINSVCDFYGADVCRSLLGLYIFTGCDQLSSFKSITKERVFKQFTSLVNRNDIGILHALSILGDDEIPSPELRQSLEKLTILLYISKKKDLGERYKELQEIGTLRWELHSKFSEDSCDLPPTPAALKFHVLRANYITLTWKRLIMSLDPILPNLVGNGWDSEMLPVMTDELPAPESSLELTICKCSKTHCTNNQCSCRKNKLQCTEACQCKTCENEELSFEESGLEP